MKSKVLLEGGYCGRIADHKECALEEERKIRFRSFRYAVHERTDK